MGSGRVVRGAGAIAIAAFAAAALASPAAAWRPGTEAARAYAKTRPGTVSFAISTPGGRVLNYHGHKRRWTASLVKPLLLVTYLRRPDVRDRGLTGYERKRLLGPMIRRSSNVAASEVRDSLGAGAVEHLAAKAGMRDFTYDPSAWGKSYSSAIDQARFFRVADRLAPRRHRGYVLRLLANIRNSQRWGIAEVAPRGWRLHFKGGWGIRDSSGMLLDHQAALLRRDGCRVTVAVMSDGNPLRRTGKQTERGIANRLLDGLRRARC